MLHRRRRTAVVLSVALVASLAAARAPADPVDPPPAPIQMSLPGDLVEGRDPPSSVEPPEVSRVRPPDAGVVRVLLISSGVDTSVFPEELRSQIEVLWGAGDPIGYGTYASTVLLQLIRGVEILSISVYDGTTFNPHHQESAFRYALDHVSDLDAVLYAVPPSDFVDPSTLLMATGSGEETEWAALLEALGDNPLRAGGHTVFGISTDEAARAAQVAGAPAAQRALTARWAEALRRWDAARLYAGALEDAGLPVVAPAGDLGPTFQTIFGIATLPSTIAVGASAARVVVPTSSSGPSIDMRAKPDLVAPGNLSGLVPDSSLLAGRLPQASLPPDWFVPLPPAGGRLVRVDSTIAAAAVVAAQVGALAAGGIRDARLLRGALLLSSDPVAGVPVWRQGAGILSRAPSVKDVRANPTALGRADLGAEPASGPWAATVPFSARPDGARAALGDFAGIGLDTSPVTRSLGVPASPTVSIDGDGVRLETGMGEEWEAGVYCGHTTVAFPFTSSSVTPKVSGDGLPPGVREHVPTCLLNGTRLVLHGFYIHDQPAENLTFAILPDVPERETVLSGIPRHLPVDPLSWELFQATTDASGNAVLPNVPPGYFRFRQFSDYGSPVSFRVRAPGGAPVVVDEDLGDNPAYQDVLSGYVLSATSITEDDLRRTFGDANVQRDAPTGAYWVAIGPRRVRIVLGWLKKMPGPAVSSRFVDLITRDNFHYALSELPGVPSPSRLAKTLGASWPLAADGWLFEGINSPSVAPRDGESIHARYNGLHPAGENGLDAVVGLADYTFNLTKPNYITHVSLSFSYQIRNSLLAAVIQIDGEVGVKVLGNALGVSVAGDSGALVPRVSLSGVSQGKTTLDFSVTSHNASSGLLALVFIPAAPVAGRALPVATVDVGEISMRVGTWTSTLWPATLTPGGQGHAFEVDPNIGGMDHPACRLKVVGNRSYSECEDWVVLVHSPGDDAETVAVRRGGVDVTEQIAAAGGALFDPQRGVARFSSRLAHELSLDQVRLGIDLPDDLATNGRFWEQLAVPLSFLRTGGGMLRFEIVDNLIGRASWRLPHRPGGVEVAPFLPYPD